MKLRKVLFLALLAGIIVPGMTARCPYADIDHDWKDTVSLDNGFNDDSDSDDSDLDDQSLVDSDELQAL